MKPYIRAHIAIDTQNSILDLLFVMNESNDGEFPPELDNFRIYGTPSTEKIAY